MNGINKTLEISGLTKNFGRIQAVKDLSLTIEPGQVFGILGPNGSGKTTTLGMILEVIAPTSGSYSWFDGKPHVESRKLIGSILESPSFYPYLSAVQNLKIVAHIKQVSVSGIDTVLEQVNLHERKDDKFRTYSLGMKQRLSIAAALLADPPVLILDEPTNGLDPEGIAQVRQLIRDIAKKGKTIIMASHLLDEVQKVCTHFCVLSKGQKLHQGVVNNILGETNTVEVACDNLDELNLLLEKFKGQKRKIYENGSITIELNDDFEGKDVNQFCHENGVILTKLITKRNSLEQEFLKILKEND